MIRVQWGRNYGAGWLQYRQVLQISFSPIISHFCGLILGQFLVRQKFQNNCECRLILKENSEQRPFNLKARNSLENIPKGCPRHIYTFLDILPWLHWGCCLGGRLGWPNSRGKKLSTVCHFARECGIWRYMNMKHSLIVCILRVTYTPPAKMCGRWRWNPATTLTPICE